MNRNHASSRMSHTPDDSRDDDDNDDEDNEQGARKHIIQFDTFKKWQRDFDKNSNPSHDWTA